jgi:hypothetical protein
MAILMLPTAHINGTSKSELFDKLFLALDAISEARSAVQATAPNARDYYPQGDMAIRRALSEHVGRLEKIQQVYDELHAIAEYVQL